MEAHWYGSLNKDTRQSFRTVFGGFGVDALQIQLYAFVLPVLLSLWGLSHSEAGLLAAAALISSAAGGWAAGLLADRFGRVRILKLTIVWFAISTCLCGLATNFEQLLIARLMQGLGLGAEMAVGAVFIAEIAAPKLRGRMVGMAQSGWAIGWGLAAVVSAVTLTVFPPELGWRVTFFVGLVPAILVFLFRRRLKEPAAFLSSTRTSSWRAILSGENIKPTIWGSLLAAGMHSGYWAIATWWPAMLQAEHGLSAVGSGPHFAALVTGSFFGYMVGSWLGDTVGRKATLISFAVGGIALALIYSGLSVSPTSALLLSIPLGFFATGMFGVIGSILTELFPTEIRGSGLGFCYNCGRGVAGITPALIGGSVESLGVADAITLYVICAYSVVLLIAILLPETRGTALRSLSETESQSPSPPSI